MHLKGYQLVLLALAITLFPRIASAAGAPKIVDFLHFALVPVVFGLIYPKIRPYCFILVWLTLALLGAIIISAFVNGSGAINVALDFMLLAEPFLLLAAIVGISWSHASVKRFRYWLLLFASANVGLAYFQFFVLRVESYDDVKGIYFEQGAGHHIAGAVALSTALFFLVDLPGWSRWSRIAIAAFFAPVVLLSDSKQALLVLFISLLLMGLLSMFRLKVGKAFAYLAMGAICAGMVEVLDRTIYSALGFWADPELASEGLERKSAVFSTIANHYTSPLNWLVGLGPGQTTSRLGQMFSDYLAYLEPLGATRSSIPQEVFAMAQENWITNSGTGSSMWSPMFSWAGVWGDLGLLGLGIYLCLWFTVLRGFCSDDLSRFLIITILVFGAVFTWMEEPGYVLFMIALVGLRWQEHQIRERMLRQKHLRKRILAGYDVGAAARPVAYEPLIRRGS